MGYKLKKLYGKDLIKVDEQILRWRKFRKQKMQTVDPQGHKTRPVEGPIPAIERLKKMFE